MHYTLEYAYNKQCDLRPNRRQSFSARHHDFNMRIKEKMLTGPSSCSLRSWYTSVFW